MPPLSRVNKDEFARVIQRECKLLRSRLNSLINRAMVELHGWAILGDPEVTANIYCKSRNLPNTDTQNYSTDLRQLLGHPVGFEYQYMRTYIRPRSSDPLIGSYHSNL